MSEKSKYDRSKAEILSGIQAEYELLEEALAGLDEDQMMQSGVEGDWSVKDVVGHIAIWQKRMMDWVLEARQGDVPQQDISPEELHEWNHQDYLANQDRALADILVDFRRWHQEAVSLTESIPEAELCDLQRYPWLNGKPLWVMIVGDTTNHYRDHRQNIARWHDQL
ncbi:MAG: ClbS/DfsB family four-helix bundle protein [Chloroflexota bacterium]